MRQRFIMRCVFLCVCFLCHTGCERVEEDVLTLYSTRQPFLLAPLVDVFERQSGIDVRVVSMKSGMLERLKIEGESSLADVLYVADYGDMVALAREGLLSVVRSGVLEERIAPAYRPDNRWFGVSKRVRAIFVHKDRVSDGSILGYEDMTLPFLRGRVCMRSGLHNYNVGLVASMWEHRGRQGAEDWLKALKGQLARKPQGNDRAQAQAIYRGVCDVTLMNSYYLGKMLDSADEEQHAWARALRMIFPNEGGGGSGEGSVKGSYVSLSAVAVAGHSRHRGLAQQFIEFLVSREGQTLLMEENKEYPIDEEIALSPLLQSWGRFTEVPLDFTAVALRRGEAARMIDALRFDR